MLRDQTLAGELTQERVGASLDRQQGFDPVFFDHPDFNSHFVQARDSEKIAQVILPDLTCYACVWLCERAVAQAVPDASLSVNLSDKSAQIRLSPNGAKLSDVVRVLSRLGYEVVPGSSDNRRRVQRASRIRMGVALLCAVNIMSFAAAEYVDLPWLTGGRESLTPEFRQWFRLLQGAFALPVLLWSAIPFWKGAWRSLHSRTLGIDLPISTSLFAASIFSYFSLWRGEGDVYFDSLSAGVALLLLGRSIQDRSIQKSEQALRLTAESQQDWVRKLTGENIAVVKSSSIVPGDLLQLLPGDVLPFKGRVVKGTSYYSAERVSGEPDPICISEGDVLPAQVLNLSSPLTVEALENGAQAYWEKAQLLIEQLRANKAAWSRRAEYFASYFFAMVCLVALGCLVYFGPTRLGFERAIAVLLIACPCAFGFAIPLTYANACAFALGRGVIFKSQHAFETLAKVGVFVFDKTGTLTQGKLTLIGPETISDFSERKLAALSKLTSASAHPMTDTIRQVLVRQGLFRAHFGGNPVKEKIGKGVSFIDDSGEWRLGDLGGLNQTEGGLNQSDKAAAYFSHNGKLLHRFAFDDLIDTSAKTTITALEKTGAQCYILSGDSSLEVDRIANLLGVSVLDKGASPERKLQRIQQTLGAGSVAMIGNGVNDSFAIAGSTVGIAVANSTPAAKQAADVVLTFAGIEGVYTAYRLARGSLSAILTTFLFAACYNFFGLALAISGHIGPLTAAVFMPLASLWIVRLSMRRPELEDLAEDSLQ